MLIGFDCKNPTEVESFELESVEQIKEQVKIRKQKKFMFKH